MLKKLSERSRMKLRRPVKLLRLCRIRICRPLCTNLAPATWRALSNYCRIATMKISFQVRKRGVALLGCSVARVLGLSCRSDEFHCLRIFYCWFQRRKGLLRCGLSHKLHESSESSSTTGSVSLGERRTGERCIDGKANLAAGPGVADKFMVGRWCAASLTLAKALRMCWKASVQCHVTRPGAQ